MDLQALNPPSSCLAAAVCLWTVQALFSLIAGQKCSPSIASRFFILPCLFLGAAAICGWNSDVYFQPPSVFRFGNEPVLQHIDTLASVFLGLLSVLGIAVSLYSPGYLKHLQDRINGGQYWCALSIFMPSMVLLVSSSNAIAFIVFWEIMSLSSLALVASEHKHRRVQQAAVIYLGATRIATAFLTAGFLWMHALTHSWSFSHWSLSTPALGPALLILIGLCIKAGSWPCHIWLPYAHPAAPSPVSALMSGVMIKMAIYAIIRILVMQDLASELVGHITLALGMVSSLWGVLFALVQSDLKRLLAYSSVENVGLILLGIGLSMLAKSQHLDDLAAIALTASIFHCFNHGVFKTLLFFAAGSVDASTHTRDLAQLGGLGRKMPFTMTLFIIGCASACALPPLNGFASKWLLYQSLLQTAWQSNNLVERSLGLASVGTLALVGGLAVATFCKAAGITFLGNPRSRSAEHAIEGTSGMVAAQALLAVISIAVGIFAPQICGKLQVLSASILKVSCPSQSYFTVPLPLFTLIGLCIFAVAYGCYLRPSQVRKFITWECGFGDLTARTQATAVSFAQPMARIFGGVMRFKLLVEITGKDRRNFPDHIKVEPQMISLLETFVYLPTISWIQNLSRAFAKLQAGSIHLYLLYVCATLVILMLVGTRL